MKRPTDRATNGPRRDRTPRLGPHLSTKKKNAVGDEADVYNAIRDQVRYAQKKHPEAPSLWELAHLLTLRATACEAAAASQIDPNHKTRTAQLALQVATLAVRILQEHGLPLPTPPDDEK